MVSAVKWEDALSVSANKVISLDLGTTLAENTVSAFSSILDNATGLDMLMWFELKTSDNTPLFNTTAPGVGASATVYMAKSIAGSIFEGKAANGGAGYGSQIVCTIPIPANTTEDYIIVGPFSVSPIHGKFYIDANWNSAAVLTAEWELNVYTNNPESQ